MPITTFLSNYEKIKALAVLDKDLNELLQEVRKIENNFYLQERVYIKRRFLRTPIIVYKYTLYFDYLAPKSDWDIQIVNLGELGEPVSKEIVSAYLLGFLAGSDKKGE